MRFLSTKTYDYNEGLSCAFRQWKATGTHCKYLHGYALRFHIVFGCTTLDDRNWVQNFGGLKDFKEWLHRMFDHTVIVAEDDPELQRFKDLSMYNLIQLRILPAVGCERIAQHTYGWLEDWLQQLDQTSQMLDKAVKRKSKGVKSRVHVVSVEVSEHSGNSAIYTRESL